MPEELKAENLALVLDPVAEAIHESIFDEPLGPDGTIERALYRQAAEAGLRAGVAIFCSTARTPATHQLVGEVKAALMQSSFALHSFHGIIAHRFDGDGSYYWTRDPTHDEAQAAMKATYDAAALLEQLSGEGG